MKSQWCGTPHGYLVHHTSNDPACDDCLHARRIYMRWWRFINGKQTDPYRCTACGSVFTGHLCTMT